MECYIQTFKNNTSNEKYINYPNLSLSSNIYSKTNNCFNNLHKYVAIYSYFLKRDVMYSKVYILRFSSKEFS